MMRTLTKLALALGMAACIGPVALAQNPRGGAMDGGGMTLLNNEAVQKELKLTDEQIEKAGKVAGEMRAKVTERLQGLEGAERREKMQAIQKEMAAESKKAIGELLKPEQASRFKQISLQTRGVSAFADPEVQSRLKLTDEQKDKLKGVAQEGQAQSRELFQGGDRAEGMRKFIALQKGMKEKCEAMLSDDQKATWKEMTGDPFEVPAGAVGRRPGAVGDRLGSRRTSPATDEVCRPDSWMDRGCIGMGEPSSWSVLAIHGR